MEGMEAKAKQTGQQLQSCRGEEMIVKRGVEPRRSAAWLALTATNRSH